MPRKPKLLTFVPDEPSLTPRKRINSVAKGRRNERKTHKWLEQRGYTVHTTTRGSHRGNDNDIFNLFDHVAVVNEGRGPTMIFVQTKSNSPGDAIGKLRDFWNTHKFVMLYLFVFVWHDRESEPRIYRVTNSRDRAKALGPEFVKYLFGEPTDED